MKHNGDYCASCQIWVAEMDPERITKDGKSFHGHCFRAMERKIQEKKEEVERFWMNLAKFFPAGVQ